MDHPDREAQVLGVGRTLEHAVAHAQMLVADPLEPEVRMTRAERLRPGERRIAEASVGEVEEGGVEPGTTHADEPIRPYKVRHMGYPAWLGIGAQRSGTTWLTDLLTQHPQVALGTNDKKEQQLLHKIADGRLEDAEYLDLFPDDGRTTWGVVAAVPEARLGAVRRCPGDARRGRCWCCCATRSSGTARRCCSASLASGCRSG